MKTQSAVMDEKKAEAFARRLLEHLNSAALSLVISLGHRTGLFDAMRTLPPSRSEAIAQAAGLHERYVREALGALVCGRIVDFDADNATYFLPPEHAAYLTREASPDNIAVTMQWIGVLASAEDKIAACFQSGGGVRYEDFPRFHEVMAEESRQTVVLPLINTLIPLVPGLKEKLERGIEVLDVGCGSGYALIHLAEHFPMSRFTGRDLCPEAVERARRRAAEKRLVNIGFEVYDAARTDTSGRFDLITTFDAVHDQADPASVLKNIYTQLKEDGVYFMQEIKGSSRLENNLKHPAGVFGYTVSCMHCMSVSLGQGGAGLGAMWGRETVLKMVKEAGFQSVEVRELPHDFINDYYLIRKK